MKKAKILAKECDYFADELALVRSRRQFRKRFINSVFVLIGLASVLGTYIPEIQALIGDNPQEKIAVIAAIALIISAIYPMFISSDPPERFADYAHYIRSYNSKIVQTINHPNLTEDQKKHRLVELMNIARSNLDDTKNKWPTIAQSVRKQMADT